MTHSADRFRFRGIVANRAAASLLVHESGDAALVDRGRPRLLVMRCPCGCGDEITLNLDRRAGRAWTMYQTAAGTSLYPSVWRDTGCKSHFVIWNDRIFLSGRSWWSSDEDEDEDLRSRVLGALSPAVARHYFDIATELDEIPWRVLVICRSLVRAGLASEAQADSGAFSTV